MKVHFICGYYSDLAHQRKRRPEPYWDALNFVWAVKVGTFKHTFLVHTKERKIKITAANFNQVRKMFGKFIAETLQREDAPERVLLIPVPSKDAVANVAAYRSHTMLVEAMADTAYAKCVLHGIRWSKTLPKAHEDGGRDRAFWRQHMQVSSTVNGRDVVLVDDVLSTGSTFLAAKEALEAKGANVLFGIACGRTIYDFETKPFKRQSITFEEEIHEMNG
jgi:uracil phosphoribosyltransferase